MSRLRTRAVPWRDTPRNDGQLLGRRPTIEELPVLSSCIPPPHPHTNHMDALQNPQPTRSDRPRLHRVLGWSAACALLMFLSVGSASADTYDCFPLCKPEPPAAPVPPQAADAKTTASNPNCPPTQGMTMKSAIEQAEALNDQIKPIKEMVGYVQSPQGLVMKLINDYVVKIPAWIGFVMDPVGTLKNRAVGEARDYAKSELKKSVGADAAKEGSSAGDPQGTEACPPPAGGPAPNSPTSPAPSAAPGPQPSVPPSR